MPLAKNASCQDCVLLGAMCNCRKHMKQCNATAWHSCPNPECLRFLCWEHMQCYCESGRVGQPLLPVQSFSSLKQAKREARDLCREKRETKRVRPVVFGT